MLAARQTKKRKSINLTTEDYRQIEKQELEIIKKRELDEQVAALRDELRLKLATLEEISEVTNEKIRVLEDAIEKLSEVW